VFDLERIEESGLVSQIDFHESLGSTNDRALEIGASGDLKLPLLVLAKGQTAGRGRGANRWLTADGALTFSLVLEAPAERLPMRNRPQVALVAGVAVAEALSSNVPRQLIQLKWPNDIYLNGRKLGGILCESIPGWADRFVVGIGININNRIGDSEISATATSLIDSSGIERDLTGVLMAVLDEIDRRWNELLECGFGPAADVYRGQSFLTGKMVTVAQHDGSQMAGMCRGIDEFGGLILRTASGEKSLISGSVVGWED
jgi:BirA family transcriptional regulator, biotin operon repressor / biotin---[acetyl-CoA-carboxylase] ligase